MPASYQQLFTITAIMHCVLYLAALAILIVGWRRNRHVGYLILIVWALLSVGALLGRSFWMPYMQPLIAKLFGGSVDPSMAMVVTNVLGGLATSLALCIGLAALVFLPSRSR
jgi:hypothetical protein